MSSSNLTTGASYWIIVLSLLALGLVTIFSIGMALWLVALAMILLSPFRSKPRIFWSGLALVLGFLVGYVLVVPWGCTQTGTFDTATGQETISPIVCRSLTGVEYSGPEPFEPSRTPAVISGGVAAVLAAIGAWMRLGKTSAKDSSRHLVE